MNLFKIKYLRSPKLLILFFLGLSLNTLACDICGCYMGITPYYNQNQVSVLYRYRSFNGYSGQPHQAFPAGSDFFIPKDQNNAPLTSHKGDPADYEIYRSLELRGKYFLNDKIELNAILPYVSNSENYNGNLHSISGLGDVNLYAGYHVWNRLNGSTKQQLVAGLGVKLPTGKISHQTAEGMRYGTLMQTGTGSTDAFIYLNYMIGIGKFGASLNASYKVNGQNKFEESVANSSTQFLNLFYRQRITEQLEIMPAAQFFYEYSAGEKYKNKRTGDHVMNNLMGGLALDVFYKQSNISLGYQRNIWEQKTDHPLSAAKVFIGLSQYF